MDQENFQEQLNIQQEALVKIYKSVEKTRKYILWSGIFSILMFVVPLLIALFALPKIIGTLNDSLGSLSELEQSGIPGGLDGPKLDQLKDLLANI